jgi:hypothetical protein
VSSRADKLKLVDTPLVCRMALRRVTLPVVLRIVPVRRVVRPRRARRREVADPRRLHATERLARRLWRDSSGTCLARSVALYLELRGLGAKPVLFLGIARPDESVLGHAWVEIDGDPLLEGGRDPRANYSELLSLDSAGSVVPAGTRSAPSVSEGR